MNIKQILNYIFPCFAPKPSLGISNNNSNILENITSENLNMVRNSKIHFINLPPKGPTEGELFLTNKSDTIGKMIKSFVNHHGIDSDQVKSLVYPETELADRAYNIHIITGNGQNPILQHSLRNKKSMSKYIENDVTSITFP